MSPVFYTYGALLLLLGVHTYQYMENTNTARNFALQLGSLIALYISLTAVLMVAFGVINIMHPDAAAGYWEYESSQQGIRFGIAMLIVFFPTVIILTRLVNQIRRKETGTYMISLLVGGGILLGDFVYVILTYLNGEITTRFILKALAMALVVGSAFYYFICDARGYWNTHEKESKMYGAGATVIVLAALVLGFMNSDTPQEVRDRSIDDQQVQDLQDMQWRIEDHYRVNKFLPVDVSALYTDVGIEAPVAKEGRDAYKYSVIDEDTYELCATFAFTSQRNDGMDHSFEFGDVSMVKNPYNNWDHGEGETCFERTIIKEPVPVTLPAPI